MSVAYVHGQKPIHFHQSDVRLMGGVGSTHVSPHALHQQVFHPFHAYQEWGKLSNFVHGAGALAFSGMVNNGPAAFGPSVLPPSGYPSVVSAPVTHAPAPVSGYASPP